MPRVTKEQLEHRAQLLKEASELSSRAKTLREEATQIEELAASDLESSGRDTTKRGGFTLVWDEKRGSVAWKQEFIRVAGAEQADRLTQSAEVKRTIKIVAPPAE